MKKLVITSLFIFLLCLSLSASAATVVEDGWITSAINLLGENDQLPRVSLDEAPNRYEAAMAVSRFIQYIDKPNSVGSQRFGVGKEVFLSDLVISYNRDQVETQKLDNNEVDALFALAQEFQGELAVLGYSIQDYSVVETTSPVFQELADANLNGRHLNFTEESLQRVRSQATNSSGKIGPQSETVKGFRLPAPVVDLGIRSTLEDYAVTEPWSVNDKGSVSSYWEQRFGSEKTGVSVVDGEVPLSEEFLLGASYQWKEAEENPSVASVGGQFLLAPDVVVEGEYSHNTDTQLGSGMMQLGATVRLGQLELGGNIRTRQSGYQPADLLELGGEGSGYGFSLRLGELSLSTAHDQVGTDNPDRLTSTSFDLAYGLPNSVLVTAEYRQLDSELKTLGELGAPSLTALGVDIPIPQGRLQLGVSSELAGANSSPLAVSALSREDSGELGTKKTTTLGLQYILNSDAAFHLNYRLIDFNDIQQATEEKANVAVAEFSIKF